MLFIIVVAVNGIDRLWIIGDQFCGSSCLPFFMNSPASQSSYIKSNFEVSVFFNTDYMKTSTFVHNTDIKNRIARLHNTVVKAMRTRGILPKFIIFLLEDDIIDYLNYNDYGVSEMYGRIMEYVLREINSSINEFRSMLPSKAKRENFPQILWLEPTLHKNYRNLSLRKKFCVIISEIVPRYENNMIWRLKKPWDPDSNNHVSSFQNKLTPLGHCLLWQAVDKTARFADFKIFNQERARLADTDRAYLPSNRENCRFTNSRNYNTNNNNQTRRTCKVQPRRPVFKERL